MNLDETKIITALFLLASALFGSLVTFAIGFLRNRTTDDSELRKDTIALAKAERERASGLFEHATELQSTVERLSKELFKAQGQINTLELQLGKCESTCQQLLAQLNGAD